MLVLQLSVLQRHIFAGKNPSPWISMSLSWQKSMANAWAHLRLYLIVGDTPSSSIRKFKIVSIVTYTRIYYYHVYDISKNIFTSFTNNNWLATIEKLVCVPSTFNIFPKISCIVQTVMPRYIAPSNIRICAIILHLRFS